MSAGFNLRDEPGMSATAARLEAWTVNADGGGLKKITGTAGGVIYPTFSPNADRLVVTTTSPAGVSMTTIATDGTAGPLQPLGGANDFMAMGWSPDGRVLDPIWGQM